MEFDASALPAARSTGVLADGRGGGRNDHVCWAYTTRAERDIAAAQWLADGFRCGQRLLVVTADADAGAQLLATITATAGADVGAAIINLAVTDLYDLSVPIDADSMLALYAGQVATAVADGHDGLRVFADITALIADPARRAAHARWEHFADAWMAAGNPLAPMCAYDIRVLGEEQLAVMAVHPLRHGPAAAMPSFGLYWGRTGRVLDGEIDAFALPILAEILAGLPHDMLDLDASQLSFLSARGAATLAHPSPDGPRLRLVNAPPMIRRLWQILEFDPEQLSSHAGN